MKRLLLDTSIYGEIIFDGDGKRLADGLKGKVVVHGFKIVRDELRQTPKSIIYDGNKIRLNLLSVYDDIIKKSYELNKEIKELAEEYYKIYKELGGNKGREDMSNDLLIVACASINSIDIVASEDNKTLLSENALKAYKVVNEINNVRNPTFIGYLKLKRWLI